MVKKTVIITGASGDIGKAIAYKFAENNYNLALCSNKNNVEYDDELKEKFKIEVKNYKMDISDYTQVENVFNKIFTDFKKVLISLYATQVSVKNENLFLMSKMKKSTNLLTQTLRAA